MTTWIAMSERWFMESASILLSTALATAGCGGGIRSLSGAHIACPSLPTCQQSCAEKVSKTRGFAICLLDPDVVAAYTSAQRLRRHQKL